MEKKHHLKGLGEMLDQRQSDMHEHFSKIFATLEEETPPGKPALAIITRFGTTTRDPPYTTTHNPAQTHEPISNEEARSDELPTNPENDAPASPTLYQPSKSSDVPFPSRLKKQKKEDKDEKLLNIFKQIHINLPFMEAMIHMPKGAKVLKDLLSHKEKLEKVASSVNLSEECSTIIQKNLPQKEGDPGSFTLPCLIGPLAVKKCPGRSWNKH
ncbi:hypothetical protein Tco_0740899 [Tanacetum coccineum]